MEIEQKYAGQHGTAGPSGRHGSDTAGRGGAFQRLSVLVLLLSVVTAVAGCGDDDQAAAAAGDPAPGTSASTTTEPGPSKNQPAQPVRKKVVVGPDGGGAGEALCTLFSSEEITARLGLPVGAGVISGPQDSACQWSVDSEDGGFVQIQRVDAEYWNEPTMSTSYKKLSGVGQKAYTDTGFPGEWAAVALHGKTMTAIGMRNGKASREAAAALLEETLTRG
jgi:hypothetical protein